VLRRPRQPAGTLDPLPGDLTRLRHCGIKMACLFYDEGDIPVCANALHGQLEILR
jgi:hypothetical protein